VGAHIIDGSGATVMPGLVGMHQHLFYPTPFSGTYVEQPISAPKLYLAAGVTSMRTSGSINGYTDVNIAKEIDLGQQPGPHIHVTAPYLDGPGNPITRFA
jgi:imidazolonepropionase-like amidohydrolase